MVADSMRSRLLRVEEREYARIEAERTGLCMTCGAELSALEEWECTKCLDCLEWSTVEARL